MCYIIRSWNDFTLVYCSCKSKDAWIIHHLNTELWRMNLEGGTSSLYRWTVATKTCKFTIDKISMKMHISNKTLQKQNPQYIPKIMNCQQCM